MTRSGLPDIRYSYVVLGTSSNVLAQEPDPATFTTIDFPGATKTLALDINSRGDIVGEYNLANTAFPDHGYLLSRGEFTMIDFPGAIQDAVRERNSRGEIVGDYLDVNGEEHGFLLIQGETDEYE